MLPFKNDFSFKDGRPCWHGKQLQGADPVSFRPLGGHWSVDDKRVYVQNSYKKQIDRSTFQYLNPVFVKDASGVYDWEGKISKADPMTFEVLDPGIVFEGRDAVVTPKYISYACDRNSVFFHEQMIGRASEIKGAEVELFKSFRNGFGADSKHVWDGKLRIKKAHAPTWSYLGHGYSIDKENVFYSDRCIEKVDRVRFSVIKYSGMNLATDGTSFFWNDREIDKIKFIEYCKKECSRLQRWIDTELKSRCGISINA